MITVPEYYQKYIDSKVDLKEVRKVCCPFHSEKTPSFSYDSVNDRWRCFGSCHTGGDVIALHKMNYKFTTRQQAIESLCALEGINYVKPKGLSQLSIKPNIDDEVVAVNVLYNKLLINANTIERYLQLDYVMSIYSPDRIRLEQLCEEWEV